MRVTATKTGFYKGTRYREGQVFEVREGVTSSWFEPMAVVDAEVEVGEVAGKKKGGKGAKATDAGPSTFSEQAKLDSATIAPSDALV